MKDETNVCIYLIVSLLLHGALGRELVGSFAGYYTLAEVDTFMVNVKKQK